MKKILYFVIQIFLILNISMNIFSENVDIKFITEKGLVIKTVDSEIESWVILSNVENPGRIYDIKGLDKLSNLKSLEIPILKYTGDFGFLNDCKKLEKLFLNGGTITSFKFLEKMENLEYVELCMYINKSDVEKICSEKINLSNLIKLNKIRFSPIIKDSNKTSNLGQIPIFINVQNSPIIFLGNNKIKTVTKDDIELLKQYSEIYLWPNPILDDENELDKLKDINYRRR